MIHDDMFHIVKQLDYDIEKFVVLDENNRLSILRPSKLSTRFKNYDREKNFQIFLTENDRHFRPNHLRVMIDLNLRVRCRPDLKKELLVVFDNIFYGADPDTEIQRIKNEHFEHYLNPIKIIANLAQLFIIEQEYGYHKESRFDPPTLFFQGWVREMIDSPKEIDNLVMSVCSFRPPTARYVNLENKKDKRYNSNLSPLWYLQ